MIKIPSFDIPKEKWANGNILSGKNLATAILENLKEDIRAKNIKPGLAVILVGNDAASQVYVGAKERDAQKNNLHSLVYKMPHESTQEEVLARIHSLNLNPEIHGILVQLPLPQNLSSENLLQAIAPHKDADGFHFENMGRLFSGSLGTVACTPLGIMVMLTMLGEDLAGKRAVVLGRSNIVGKPMASLLLNANCTVTVCHSRSKNIEEIVREADIVVSATGHRNIFDENSISDKAIVIDVGMHREGKKLMGDLDFDKLANRVRYITPVPGGVGPMTRAMLIYNTVQNAIRLKEEEKYV